MTLFLQLRQLGLREVKALSPDHTASEGKDPGTNSDHLMSQVLLVLLMLNREEPTQMRQSTCKERP